MQKQFHFNKTQSLPKQFLITREAVETPETWQTVKLGDYHLYCPAELPVVRIRCRTYLNPVYGEKKEIIALGWFGYQGEFFPNSQTNELVVEDLERAYPAMTGRFIIIQHDNSELFVTTDAGAQFPVVYRAATGEVASTPGLLGWTEVLRKSATSAESYIRADDTFWLPFDVTPYTGVRRLLPQQRLRVSNHGCGLADWNPATSRTLDVSGLVASTSEFINSLVTSQVTVECHLTAGWDSRMVLAASWPHRKQIEYLTYRAPGANARIDNQVASAIARKYALSHECIEVTAPNSTEVDLWMERTSHCIKDSVRDLSKTVADSYKGNYGLAGVGGEVGRAFYWGKKDLGKSGMSASQLLTRLGFQPSGIAFERAQRWLSNYSDLPDTRILDRAYIDIRLGCWSGPSMCGHLIEKPTLSPFNSVEVFESMINLPEEYRLSGQFARDFIAESSLELSQLPVNRLWGLQRVAGFPRELARQLPKGVRSQIRGALSKSAAT